MKHIFKKLHFGNNNDTPNRSNEVAGPSSPNPCASDIQTLSDSNSCNSPVTPSPVFSGDQRPPASAPVARDDESFDYFSSEEEYQVQLALAISASSNDDFPDDHEKDQIRVATLLSLGRSLQSSFGNDDSAEGLSRQYWDYNVLDYEDKVLDGFYDVYGISTVPASQGKMPSLTDLQTTLGDLGFEVVIVNRAIDPALELMEQVARSFSLDCPVTEVGLLNSRLVQRIADLVTEHMGGPVRDASDMLAKWTVKNTELRTSLQTTVLPIGCLNVGLSRHRALLFKVLADTIGIPCKLVKGSHYTGIDDDAVNIIKTDNEREFLVDLMAAPGTLIPADILSTKDAHMDPYDLKLSKNQIPWTAHDPSVGLPRMGLLDGDHRTSNGKSTMKNDGIINANSSSEQAKLTPSLSIGNCSDGNSKAFIPANQSSIQKGKPGRPVVGDGMKEKLNVVSYSQDVVDSQNLFADLNPFQVIGAGKTSTQNRTVEKKINEFQMQGENISSTSGRPSLPLMRKNRAACDEVPGTNQQDFMEGFLPRKNLKGRDINALSVSTSSSPGNAGCLSSRVGDSSLSLRTRRKQCGTLPLINDDEHKNGEIYENIVDGIKEHDKSFNKHDRSRCTHDMSMGPKLKEYENSCFSDHAGTSRLDPMLEDVAEWEILWEDLVIGERIGLGSYGEVYHADWNGTEVAVKKFLEQDFSGDALEEFRREVRIMRRLRHPNVVLFMGAVTCPPNLSIVTEFLPRGSLYRILHRPNFQIDEKCRIKMALDVAKGMNCLHSSIPTIVHRDLKSLNLLVDKNWNVKVCDFGLSRMKHNTFLSSKSTGGTPEWMAPEVLRNEPSNEKCDVYSFGVILWELATMRMPWSGMNPMQVVGAVGFQNRRLDIPKEIDPLVARIIWDCWQTEPSVRPSFVQLTTALKPLQQLVISPYPDAQSSHLPQEISVNSTPERASVSEF